jgi:RimJ/RimL family protein N-acetyltransferase
MDAPRLSTVELLGERVRLRPAAAGDAPAAFAALHRREPILRWLLWDGPEDEAELARHYGEWLRPGERGDDLLLALEERASGAFAGMLSLRFAGHPGIGDLGYWIAEPFWGRGLASEAIALAAHLAFRHLAATSLCAWVFVGNDASRRALEKNDFSLVQTRPRAARKAGREVDEWYLVLLRAEWEARGAPPPLARELVRFAEPPPA